MKSLFSTLNEAREEVYAAQLLGMFDTVKILVPHSVVREFENFAMSEEGKLFAHISGGSIEY